VTFAHRLIDYGVDVIIGHHPHVLQPIEVYKNGIIAYSLGNLIFGGNSRYTYDTALLEIRIGNDEISHAIRPVAVEGWKAREMKGGDARKFIRMVESLPLPDTE
jgi:poly-gamma-glutamate synthesis protein (capsule biosynthesis protein)